MSTVQLPCRAKDWWLDKAIYTRLALSSSPSQWHKKARRLFSTRDENWRIRKNVILLSCHEKDLKKCRNVFPLLPPSSGHLGRSQNDSNSLHSEIFTWFKWLPSLIFSIYTSLPSEKEKKSIYLPTQVCHRMSRWKKTSVFLGHEKYTYSNISYLKWHKLQWLVKIRFPLKYKI